MSATPQPVLDLPPAHWALLHALLDPDRSIPDILKALSLSARDLLAAVPALTAALQALASLSSLRNQLLSLPKALTSLQSVCADSADPIERRRAATTIARVAISPPRAARASSVHSPGSDPIAAAAAKLQNTLCTLADEASSPAAPRAGDAPARRTAGPIPHALHSEIASSGVSELLSPLDSIRPFSSAPRSRTASLASRAGALAAGP